MADSVTGNARPNAAVIPNRENAFRRESSSCSIFSVMDQAFLGLKANSPSNLIRYPPPLWRHWTVVHSIARYLDVSLSNRLDVRYWPLADISLCTAHVRFEGESGHGLLSL